jgi:hypothetical protein
LYIATTATPGTAKDLSCCTTTKYQCQASSLSLSLINIVSMNIIDLLMAMLALTSGGNGDLKDSL